MGLGSVPWKSMLKGEALHMNIIRNSPVRIMAAWGGGGGGGVEREKP